MSRLLDDDQDTEQRHRELTLSTGAILAIFLGLMLLCAVFFGFGYNLGRKSNAIAAANAPASSDSAPDANFDNFKPAPSPTASKPAETTHSSPTSEAAAPEPAPAEPGTAEPAKPTASAKKLAPATAKPQPATAPAPHPAAAAAAPVAEHGPGSAAPAVTPGGAFIVQVAAISHKDDADLLVNALRAKGYQVSERSFPQDKLLHIQVGPYATKAQAEAMRERLIVDGYNAIVK